MVPGPYRYCFKLFDSFRSCKILFGLVKFMTAPDRMSGNGWEVFVNTEIPSASKDVYMYSFFPQTIRDWNNLPESLISSSKLSDDSVSKFTSLVRARD